VGAGAIVALGSVVGVGGGAVGGALVAVGAGRVGCGDGFAVGFGVGDFRGAGGTWATCGTREMEDTADRAMKKAAAATTNTSRNAIRSGVMSQAPTRACSARTLAT
jgi:hypothetical protein